MDRMPVDSLRESLPLALAPRSMLFACRVFRIRKRTRLRLEAGAASVARA